MTAPSGAEAALAEAVRRIEALPGPNGEGIDRWPEAHQETYMLAIEEAASVVRALAPSAGPDEAGHAWRAVGPNAEELWNQCSLCGANDDSTRGRAPCPAVTP